MTQKQQQTILLGVVLALILLGAGYFAVAKPQLSQRAENSAATEDAETRTATLRTELATLKDKQAKLPEAEKDARALTAKFPNTYEQDAWINMVLTAADRAGVEIISVDPSEPVAPGVDPNQAAAAAAQAGAAGMPGTQPGAQAGAQAQPGTQPNGQAAANPAAPQAPTPAGKPGEAKTATEPAEFLVAQSDVSIMADGKPDRVERFIAALENMKRPLLIDAVQFAASDRGANGGGREGSSMVTITGKTFLSRGLDTPVAAPAGGE